VSSVDTTHAGSTQRVHDSALMAGPRALLVLVVFADPAAGVSIAATLRSLDRVELVHYDEVRTPADTDAVPDVVVLDPNLPPGVRASLVARLRAHGGDRPAFVEMAPAPAPRPVVTAAAGRSAPG